MEQVVGTWLESARAITPSKMAKNKNIKTYAHLHIIRKHSAKLQINPIKDVEGVARKRILTNGRIERQMDTHMDGQGPILWSPSKCVLLGSIVDFISGSP